MSNGNQQRARVIKPNSSDVISSVHVGGKGFRCFLLQKAFGFKLHLLKQVLGVWWLALKALRQDHSQLIRRIRPQSTLDDGRVCADGTASVYMIPLRAGA
jgi:hypothetical protein